MVRRVAGFDAAPILYLKVALSFQLEDAKRDARVDVVLWVKQKFNALVLLIFAFTLVAEVREVDELAD